MEICYHPIGVIHTPFSDLEGMPVQPTGDRSVPGVAEVHPEYAEGLQDLAGFSHVVLIYHLHQAGPVKLTVTPFLDKEPRGLFATRAPARPNPIGLSVVELERVEGNRLYLANLDVLDGTPLLDIKPHIPQVDSCGDARVGWLADVLPKFRTTRSDDRFK